MTIQFTHRRGVKPSRHPNRIREYRLRAGLTQRRLAEMLGVSRGLVSSWERGHYVPTLSNAFRLARALDTLAESLYQALYDGARLNKR